MNRFNYIRLPFDLSAGIRQRYGKEGKARGYSDIRDFFSDLANEGFQTILLGQENGVTEYDHTTFARFRERLGFRIAKASVDLKAVPLKEICFICRSNSGIDTYDTLSILISIGWTMNPDCVKYIKKGINVKIYS